MPIALKADFSVAADPTELLFDFPAYPGGRAITGAPPQDRSNVFARTLRTRNC